MIILIPYLDGCILVDDSLGNGEKTTYDNRLDMVFQLRSLLDLQRYDAVGPRHLG